MYSPPVFSQPDKAALQQLMRDHPFATLVTLTEDGMEANHVPLILRDDGSEYGVLVGHLARPNPVWKTARADQPVLVIFHGPHAYITPSWYSTKQEHGKVVPTWNYMTVHASGYLRVNEDPVWLHGLLTELTEREERKFAQPWAVQDAPADYIAKLSAAIVGIEIPLTQLSGKWKLSQNQSEANRHGVAAGLAQSPEPQHQMMAGLIPR